MTSGSLRLRLMAGGLAAVALSLLVAGAGLTWLFERQVLHALADDLERDVRQILANIDLDADGHPALRRPLADPRFSDPLSGLYWQISADKGQVSRSRSLWDATLPMPADQLRAGEVHRHRISGPAGSDLLAVERTVEVARGAALTPVRVVVAADLARVAEARRSFVGDLVPALGVLGLALGLAMWVQTGLGLRPLQRLRASIADIRQGRRRQLDESEAPSEVVPLVEEVNALLASQAAELERSRDRAADLAHGLKTPLVALSADARNLKARGEHELAASIDDVVGAMRRHVERELARARVRGRTGRPAPAPARVKALLEKLVALHSRTPAGGKLEFEIRCLPETAVGMDTADLAEVLGNLIENAVRHARSHIRVSASAEGGAWTVAVEDDGAGIARPLREKALERGGRLDSKGAGAGLGLAIVQDVLEAYGRRLSLETSDLGGLKAAF